MRSLLRCIAVLVLLWASSPAYAANDLTLDQGNGTFQKLGGVGDRAKTSATLEELLGCEDILAGRCVVEERYMNIPVGGTTAMIAADQLYKTGPGYVRDIKCWGNDATAVAGTITVRDNTTAGAGNILHTFTILAADYSKGVEQNLQTSFSIGLFLDFTDTNDVSCVMRYRG